MDEGRVLLGNIKYHLLNSYYVDKKNCNLLVMSNYWVHLTTG